jgi:1D-myo-inositol 3-kinase
VSPPAARPSVLVAGHVTLDAYGDAFAPGGSAYYAARTYLALGAGVRVATAAAQDFPAGALAAAEVDVAPAAHTTTFENAHAPGGRGQRVTAVAPALLPRRLPAAWLECDLLHLAPVIGEVALDAWLGVARARFVGLGVQGWVRAVLPGGTVAQPPWRFAPSELAGVDAACVGEDDLLGQGGDLVERLAAAVPIVAFTRGARGCELLVRGRSAHVGTFPTREVDSTGAGDAFSAGFFLALSGGADPITAARLGAAAASVVIEGRAGDALDRIADVAAVRASAVPVIRPFA